MNEEKLDIKITNLDQISLKHYLQCFEDNGDPKKKEVVTWQFLENPIKKTFVSIAMDSSKNKTAAIYAIAPVKFHLDDEVIVGSQSLDTITDVNFRGKGLFIKLAKDVYQKANSADVKLVYGFPNGNSIYGFQKKLDWIVLDPVPFLIKPLRSAYFTNRIKLLKFLPDIPLTFLSFKNKSNFVTSEDLSFPSEVNMIWEKFKKHFKVAVNRDQTYLKWRYLEKPNENYKIFHCYGKSNEYLGFVVYTVKFKHGGSVGYIMELIYDLEKPEVGKILLGRAVDAIRTAKADCILSWCLDHSPNFRSFKNHFFFNLSENFRPIELHFGVRVFDDKIRDLASQRKNWYLSYSDSDTV